MEKTPQKLTGEGEQQERVPATSLDVENATLQKIKQTMPELLKDGKLDMEHLQNLVGDYTENDNERYSFTWKGKADCYKIAQKPSTATLRPCVEESVNFDTTKNLYIEGDNLEVLKLLQKSYYAKVKMIYIDPPYNTGNDFVYEDDFKDPIAKYKEITGQTTKSNPESMGRFHTNWLNMMWPRLRLAHNLLRDDGVIFVSIDDNEVHNLRRLMDEIFGEENYRNMIATRRYDKNLNRQFMDNGLMSMNVGLEYILVYAKNQDMKLQPVFREADEERSSFGYWKGFWNNADRPTMRYDVLGFTPDSGQWKWKKELADEAVANYEEYTKKYSSEITLEEFWEDTGKTKRFLRRNINGKGMSKGVEHWVAPQEGILRTSNWVDLLASKPTGVDIPFDSPKNADVLLEFIKLSGVENEDLILDFFSGSATTAHAVMQLNAEDGGNRKSIMVQIPEITDEKSEAFKAGYKNICEIGKERIRRAGKKLVEENADKENINNLDIGFKVLKLDTSNLQAWDTTPITTGDEQTKIETLLNRMNERTTTLKSDRTDMDVVFEVLLKMGYMPTEAITQRVINEKKTYTTNDMLICLDTNITADDITAFSTIDNVQNLVIAEESFTDSNAMSNAHYILRDKDIELKLL